MRILTLNCNGIRAAARKGLFAWLGEIKADVIKLQEVRAELTILEEICVLSGYHCVYNPAEKKGYSGTTILCKKSPTVENTKVGIEQIDREGRWCEVLIDNTYFISLYLPSGSSSDEAQVRKDIVLVQLDAYLKQRLSEAKRHHQQILISGDWNIAHTEKDIKNWRGNRKNSGFLPHERQWMTDLLQQWVDVYRYLHPHVEGEGYTWWSNRGNAYANNTGWRIDYQIATSMLAHQVQNAQVYKQQRFSDHAPLIIDYQSI